MSEAEYISKEAALACFSDWIDRYGHEHSADEMAEYQRIEDLPVEDVRPVVRCKDCRFKAWDDAGMFCCKNIFMGKFEPNGFCAWGERKEVGE
jgi:hypothetical protein